jgi:hypothetical protein
MMIQVDNEFLEFDDVIEVEKQIKLIEEISTTDGDFSYSFELQKTIPNTRLLRNPMPDNISKPVYQKIPAKVFNNSGAVTFSGYLRVEKVTDVYGCSFFAGNNNWFGMLSGMLQELDWSEYDIDLTEINLSNAIFNTSGVVFPLVDTGLLFTRGTPLLKVEDFVGAIHVKDVFNKIFSHHGIKIQGELLDDVNFRTAVTMANPRNEELIREKSAFVGKTVTQTMSSVYTDPPEQITWNDDSNPPFSNGGNFDLTTESYTSDIRQIVRVELFIACQIAPATLIRFMTQINLNGTVYEEIFTANPTTELFSVSISARIPLVAGDVIDFSIAKEFLETDPFDILNATVKITPLFIYRTIGSSTVPKWTQQKYVSNILKLFGVLPSYNEVNKTLTLNLFEKIKDKPAVDLSEYISSTEVDYSEFVSDYGKSSLFSYQETEDDRIKVNFFPYEKGAIEVDNDFLEDSADVLESDFSQPVGYLNNVFDMSMEKADFIEAEDEIETGITGVTEVSDEARFAVEEDVFEISDLVRITDSTNPNYNGDYMVSSLGAGYIELEGVAFNTDARAKVTRLIFQYSSSDNVFIFHHVPLYTINKFSGLNFITLENTEYETFTLGFFNLMNTGRQVNRDFINSLSFSGESHPLHYQQTLIDQYFRQFSRVLNDPVKLLCEAHLPQHVYEQIDFLSPITIKTMETTNQYYLNRISGYKESYYPCVLELIKI